MSGPQYFSLHIVEKILSFLPVKDLLRFRCVCKSWNSLILDPNFVKLHLQKSSRNTSILYTLLHADNGGFHTLHHCSIERLLEDPSSDTIVDGGHVFELKYKVIGVCNGLLCLSAMTYERESNVTWVRFWNPATRLASEKSPDIITYGSVQISVKMNFGYDDSTDTYKVVAVVADWRSRETVVRVLCMGDDTWRTVIGWSGFPKLWLDTDGRYVNGTLNWIAEFGTVSANPYGIYSFDLRDEKFSFLPLPNDHKVRHSPELDLGVLRGCLCLSHYQIGTFFSFWQMKEFGVEQSWVQLLKLSYESLQILHIRPWQYPWCMSRNNDILMMAKHRGCEVIIYDKRDNRVEHINFLPKIIWFHSSDYVESLVLPYRN